MNYEKIYNDLIDKRIKNPLSDSAPVELHHIKPKSIYPELEKDKNNIVALTAKEHYVAHHLLMLIYREIYGDKHRFYYAMLNAYWFNSHVSGVRITSRVYSKLKADVVRMKSNQMLGSNNPMFGKKLKECMTPEKYQKWLINNKLAHAPEKISEETRQKHSLLMSGKNNHQYGIKPINRMTPEKYKDWLLKQSEIRCGKNNPMYGKNSWENSSPDDIKRRKESASKSMSGRKRMYNPQLDDDRLVKVCDVEKFLNNGYIFSSRNQYKKYNK